MNPARIVITGADAGLGAATSTPPPAHDTDQPHPLHEPFIARNSDLWTRVQVYGVVA